jgi:hypothetical protein
MSIAAQAKKPENPGKPNDPTPVQESVCDPLLADGVTLGLYGLCLAYCEDDFSSLDSTFTEGQLKVLVQDKHSDRTLKKYNRIKLESDPDMPCLAQKLEETTQEATTCPCWTNAELAAIDGYDENANYTSFQTSCTATRQSDTGSEYALLAEFSYDYKTETAERMTAALVDREPDSAEGSCIYSNYYEPSADRYMDITAEQFESCYGAIEARCPTR